MKIISVRTALIVVAVVAIGAFALFSIGGATAQQACIQPLAGNGTISGSWNNICLSENTPLGDYNYPSGTRYARFYTFTLSLPAAVTMELRSTMDTYMYLMQGTGSKGKIEYYNDDIVVNEDSNSRISESLPAGDYTIEATTYDVEASGNFTLTVSGLPHAATPTATPTLSTGDTKTATPTPISEQPTPTVTWTQTATPTVTPAATQPPAPDNVLNRLTALETRAATQHELISTIESEITALDSRVATLEVVASAQTPTATSTTMPTLPTNSPTPVATATPGPTATNSPTHTPTSTPTPTPQPTAMPTAEEIELSTPVGVPEHMVYAWWDWHNAGYRDEITVDVKIHNNIELTGNNGIYLIVCNGYAADTLYYFGMMTSFPHPDELLRSDLPKAASFSRWGTRDLGNTRTPPNGWTESAGHEGDFVGVRLAYHWTEGEYRLRIAQDGDDDSVGRWYGLWITDVAANHTTWIGSLRFPPSVLGPAKLYPHCYNTVEVYGSAPIAPKDVPYWKVTLGPPETQGTTATISETGYAYPDDGEEFRNARFTMDEDGAIIYEVGLGFIPEERNR